MLWTKQEAIVSRRCYCLQLGT